jgi:hypothetical protein
MRLVPVSLGSNITYCYYSIGFAQIRLLAQWRWRCKHCHQVKTDVESHLAMLRNWWLLDEKGTPCRQALEEKRVGGLHNIKRQTSLFEICQNFYLKKTGQRAPIFIGNMLETFNTFGNSSDVSFIVPFSFDTLSRAV